MARIIDGNKIAQQITEEAAVKAEAMKQAGIIPHLSVILVGDDPASQVYVNRKQKTCEQNGLSSTTLRLEASTTEQTLLQVIEKMNADPLVHGILVQLPLPKHMATDKIIQAISPDKDVDGFHPVNRGKLTAGEACFVPCTPAGIQQLLLREGFDPAGKHVVVVGRSNIVGMPLAIMLAQKKKGANATVTLCHTGTKDVGYFTKQADIVVVASGRTNTLTADMVREGCVVIDVGVNRIEDLTAAKGYRLVGDVDFASVEKKAMAITPVPGGVGPMTIAMLLQNTLQAAEGLSRVKQ
jgi:methylenetetrahydrofolate dehydrogenase (NADP+) / methenyltetrahydrofolate cyclohydrolase